MTYPGDLNEFIRNELHRIMVTAQRQGPSDYDHIYATARRILREIERHTERDACTEDAA